MLALFGQIAKVLSFFYNFGSFVQKLVNVEKCPLRHLAQEQF